MSDNFANTFEETIKSETARELIVQSADIAFSKIAESGLLNGIPIFGLMNGAVKLIHDFRNFRFAEKIYRFLFQSQDIPIHKQVEFIYDYEQVNKENGYELLLSVIDRLDNLNKIDIMTNFVRNRVYKKITINEFIRLTIALERIPYPDIQNLPNYLTDCYEPGVTDMLNASGLLFESIIDANETNKYQLNQTGRDFLKYGLNKDIEDRDNAPVQMPGQMWHDQ